MEILRTPSSRFENLHGYDFAENYLEIPFDGQTLRMHYLDEGNKDAEETIVLLHGEPSWSYLYRKVIPLLTSAGHRVIAPDLIGFGKSDKPAHITDYTYDRQVEWLRTALFDNLQLKHITLYAQDWGGILSLRLVAFEPEYFARVMVANTAFPVGGRNSNFVPNDAPLKFATFFGSRTWKLFARWTPVFPIGKMVKSMATESELTPDILAGYQAPFPDNRYLAGVRAMPQLIPMNPKSPDSQKNREAWQLLANFDKPFRTAFSDGDFQMQILPIDKVFQRHIKGAQNQRHVVIENAGHFLQEDNAEDVAQELNAFISETR
jgi:haloalkane dehalogenase